jgi:hypothetical protein
MSQQDFWKSTLFPTNATGETDVSLPGTTGIVLPIGTTGERSSAPITGMMRYNTTIGEFEVYNGSWANLDTSAGLTLSLLEDADFDTQIYVENFGGIDDDVIAFTLGDNSATYTVPTSILNWSTAGFDIETPTGNSVNAGVDFTITTGDGHSTEAGGMLALISGAGGTLGDGGMIDITGGAGGVTSGDGGDILIGGGNAIAGFGGYAALRAGNSGTGFNGSDVVLFAGNTAGNASGGDIILTGGDV